MQATLAVSERRACRVVGQCRATQQYVPVRSDEEEALRARIVALAREYGRYGYRRIDPPPVIRPPVEFSHAERQLIGVTVSGAGGRYPSALCGRCVLY